MKLNNILFLVVIRLQDKDMNSIANKIEALGVVPVLVVERVADALPLAEALLAGGLPIAEVTMRTEAAPEAIKAMSSLDGLLVGAGTVLSSEQVEKAVAAGATFVVSPGLDAGVVAKAKELKIPLFAGVATASEVQKAWNLGLRTVKFFPANIAGGAKAIKALSSVFRDMSFMPTGGVSLDNLQEYLSLPAVIACGGSWIAPASLLKQGNYAEISKLAAQAVVAAKLIRGEK